MRKMGREQDEVAFFPSTTFEIFHRYSNSDQELTLRLKVPSSVRVTF
jgi:hypothetical protein